MSKMLSAMALAASMITVTPAIATAENWSVALPQAMPGGGAPVKDALWQFFLHDLGPGDRYSVLNASVPGQVAVVQIPDEAKYTRAKWRAKSFARENMRVGRFVDQIADAPADIDLMGTLRHVALNRLDDAPMNLMIIGSVVQEFPDAPAFSMLQGATALVPSPAHLSASVAQTPYGMGSEGTDGLANSYIHICPIGDGLSSEAEAAYQQFFGHYLARRGGNLVTWTEDLGTCVERFGAQVRQPIATEPFDHADDALVMRDITRQSVAIEEPTETILNGVTVDQFNIFASAAHPSLGGVQVTTGVAYAPGKYPDIYEAAYCYFNVASDGASIRIDLGDKSFDQPVVWDTPKAAALRAAGVSKREVHAGQSACQWPTP